MSFRNVEEPKEGGFWPRDEVLENDLEKKTAPNTQGDVFSKPGAEEPSEDETGAEAEKHDSHGENQHELLALIKKLEEEKAELTSISQRVQADFDNFRRRTRGEKEELIKYALEEFMVSLLPVLDNFERALAAAKEQEEGKSYLEGVEMIYRQLFQVLTNEGLKPVDALDCVFDPNCHEAVMQIENDGSPSGSVVEELQKGYWLKDRLIRPSMVKVVK